MAGIRSRLQPLVTQWMTSDLLLRTRRQGLETWRRLAGYPHRVGVWLRADDPYSYLLVQALRQFRNEFPELMWQVHWLRGSDPETTPAPDRLARFALQDCQRLARWADLGLPLQAPDVAPDPAQVAHVEPLLVAQASLPDADPLATANAWLQALWQGDDRQLATLAEGLARPSAEVVDRHFDDSRQLQRAQGHYHSGMLHYAGEWYWGIDRLGHLADRLLTLGVGEPGRRWHLDLDSHFLDPEPARQPDMPVHERRLDFYFSFRSPYSYLALERAKALAEHYGLRLVMRPVLPMVMRGLPVPTHKRLYILHDATREARRLGIPFGRICDPLGAGVERCLAVWYLAAGRQRGFDFIEAAARRIWSEGADMATDPPLLAAAREAGLSASDVQQALADDAWRARVERHQQALTEADLWGVPAFILRRGEQRCSTWGQDRLWVIEDALHDQ